MITKEQLADELLNLAESIGVILDTKAKKDAFAARIDQWMPEIPYTVTPQSLREAVRIIKRTCDKFPTLKELLSALNVAPKDQKSKTPCDFCGSTGWVSAKVSHPEVRKDYGSWTAFKCNRCDNCEIEGVAVWSDGMPHELHYSHEINMGWK